MATTVEKKVDYILNTEDFSRTTECLFIELEGVNPHSRDIPLEYFTHYPKEWYCSKCIYRALIKVLEETILNDSETLRHKFRAFLALFYLHDYSSSFRGITKLRQSEKNIYALSLAREVFDSESFFNTFPQKDKEAEKEFL